MNAVGKSEAGMKHFFPLTFCDVHWISPYSPPPTWHYHHKDSPPPKHGTPLYRDPHPCTLDLTTQGPPCIHETLLTGTPPSPDMGLHCVGTLVTEACSVSKWVVHILVECFLVFIVLLPFGWLLLF